MTRIFFPLLFVLGFYPDVAYCQKDTAIKLYFASGRSDLSAEQQAEIRFLAGGKIRMTAVTGYTDSVGRIEINQKLGYARARSVCVFLRSILNCDSFKVESKGERSPASSSDLSLNRRVDLQIFYNRSLSAGGVDIPDSITTILDVPDIHFKPDLPSIESESLEIIRETASKMKLYSCAHYEITGSVNWTPNDNIPHDEGIRKQVQLLSEKRAKTVYDLLADQGVPVENMSYAGKGNQDLKFQSPSTDQEKRQNMRVRIVIRQSTGCPGNAK